MWITRDRLDRVILYNYSMVFSVLTYNVLYNKAFIELKGIIENFHPDIICLQEVDTSEPNLKKIEQFGYQLADYTNSFIKFGTIFGVTTFYNEKKTQFTGSSIVQLPRNIYEMILFIVRILRGGHAPRTVLKTEFVLKGTKQKIIIYNTHLAAGETNEARVKQLRKILNFTDAHKNLPLIITGDLNYVPYRRKRLEKLMLEHGLKEATKSINYTMQMTRDGKFEKFNLIQKILNIFAHIFINGRLKMDYVFYKNLRLKEIKRIELRFSDHFPIISTFITR